MIAFAIGFMSPTFTPKKGSFAPCRRKIRFTDSLPFASSLFITSSSVMGPQDARPDGRVDPETPAMPLAIVRRREYAPP